MTSLYKYALDNGGNVIEPEVPIELVKSNNATNPSCVYFNNELIVSFRGVNYTKLYKLDNFDIFPLSNKNQDYLETERGINSYNIIGIFKDNDLPNYTLMNETVGFNNFYKGLEDVRLIVWNDKLYAYGTRWDKVDNKGCICIYELNDNYQAIKEIIVKSPKDSFCEKNWAAIEGKPFQFVYYHNPLEIVQVDTDTGDSKIIETKKYKDYVPDNLRGGSQVIKLDNDTYLSIAHTTDTYIDNKGITHFNYHFYAVYYYDNLDIRDVSEPFNFNQDLNEFCCGLSKVGDDLYIAYSELDATASILKINKYVFNDFIYLNSIGELDSKYTDCVDYQYFYNRAVNYLHKGFNRKAISFYNFSLIGNLNENEKMKALIAYLSYYLNEMTIFGGETLKSYNFVLNRLISKYNQFNEFKYLYRISNRLSNKANIYENDINRNFSIEFDTFINKDYIN